jgi:hypothetical protein
VARARNFAKAHTVRFSLFRKSAQCALFSFCQKCTVCAFAVLLLAALSPALVLAADAASSEPRTISLDVVAGGGLATLCGAATAWFLASRSRAKSDRQPPLGEDVARTYATKDDLLALDGKFTKDIDSIRDSIAENDRRAEDRTIGTHSRIDALYKQQQKISRSLGMLTGMLVGGKCSAAVAQAVTDQTEEE